MAPTAGARAAFSSSPDGVHGLGRRTRSRLRIQMTNRGLHGVQADGLVKGVGEVGEVARVAGDDEVSA